jgi:arylsulfatase A-like enzyme
MNAAAARDELPTIVLVVFDTARVDRFGCYGYGRPTTPTVDALADEGLLVDTMIANGPWTLPSHGSLFTGLYPSQHGSQWQTGPRLRDSVSITMPEWLRGLGYHTICATNNGLISEKTGLSRGFDRYAFRMDLERGRRRLGRRLRKVTAGGDSGGLIVNRWIRDELRDAPRPTFLFVNYLECHWAYAPPRRLEKRVGGPRFGLVEGMRYRATLARNAGPWEAIARADDRVLDIYDTLYDGELANADEHLAELMGILRETGHVGDRPSLVMVTSDHGEHLGEHRLADHHASLDDHLIRVPFVAWGPGLVEPRRQSRQFELVDVFPSVARVLGRDVEELGTATRRADLFDGGAAGNGHRYAFAEWRAWTDKELTRLAQRNASYDFTGLRRDLVCVRDERFKLVRESDAADRLFDLTDGSEESADVSADHPEDVARLGAELDGARRSWSSWEADQTVVSEEEQAEIEQRLTELGYL